MKKWNINALPQWIFILVFVILAVMTIPTVVHYNDRSEQLNSDAVKETVVKYVVQCYAIEGSYPADLYYLRDNYGLILDEEHYLYTYDIFGSNVMPDIQVRIRE